MCTVIVSFDPESPVPVLLIGVRDEFLDRPWIGPGRHWPQWPGVIGGQDLRAGGTWLAVFPGSRSSRTLRDRLHLRTSTAAPEETNPQWLSWNQGLGSTQPGISTAAPEGTRPPEIMSSGTPRVACVLNGQGEPAPESTRLSRGELPLLLAGGGSLGDLDRYDPCHLVSATINQVLLLSWNGVHLTEQALPPGLHFMVNSGLEGVEPGPEDMLKRIAHFRPRLLTARRPSPDPAVGDMAEAWGDWLPIVDGDGLARADPRAMILRRELDDQLWGTSSVSLVALRPDGVRYDFIDLHNGTESRSRHGSD